MTVISGVSSDKTKIVKFNKMMRKDSDSPSWKANISDNPLVEAFPESIDIHPGLQSSPIAPAQVQSTLSDLTSRKRARRTVAYINVPYCETRCLYCLFYIKPYRNKEESKAYADTLIKELQLWADKPIQQNEPVHAVYFGAVRRQLLKPRISNASLKRFVSTFRWPMTVKSLMKADYPASMQRRWKLQYKAAQTVSP